MRDDEVDYLRYGAEALPRLRVADYATWIFRWRNVAIVAFVGMVLGAAQMMTIFGIAPVENVPPTLTPTLVPAMYVPKADGTYWWVGKDIAPGLWRALEELAGCK